MTSACQSAGRCSATADSINRPNVIGSRSSRTRVAIEKPPEAYAVRSIMRGAVGPKKNRLKSVLEFLEQLLGIELEVFAPLAELPTGIRWGGSDAVRPKGEWTPRDEIATHRRRGNGASPFLQRGNSGMGCLIEVEHVLEARGAPAIVMERVEGATRFV